MTPASTTFIAVAIALLAAAVAPVSAQVCKWDPDGSTCKGANGNCAADAALKWKSCMALEDEVDCNAKTENCWWGLLTGIPDDHEFAKESAPGCHATGVATACEELECNYAYMCVHDVRSVVAGGVADESNCGDTNTRYSAPDTMFPFYQQLACSAGAEPEPEPEPKPEGDTNCKRARFRRGEKGCAPATDKEMLQMLGELSTECGAGRARRGGGGDGKGDEESPCELLATVLMETSEMCGKRARRGGDDGVEDDVALSASVCNAIGDIASNPPDGLAASIKRAGGNLGDLEFDSATEPEPDPTPKSSSVGVAVTAVSAVCTTIAAGLASL